MIDRVFGNRYRIIERIGIGGMAEVYRATDEVLGRTVALKLMLPQYAADPTFAARFKQEAQAAANLQSPYIVNIYDWGREETDQTFYIVMELVRGTDLKTAINQRGALNQRKAAEVASQVCAALSVAHSYDIIHRDIKPHNIMVQPDGNAKVMDFGIARANGSSMTQTGSVLGTAYYVSPEQAQGRELTPATDLYSLGIVLYEAVTGQLPFDGPDAVSVALKQVNQQPQPPSEIDPNIDADLEAIILKAMSKQPADRFITAEAMRVALHNYLTGLPVDTSNPDPQAITTVMGATPARRPVGSRQGQDADDNEDETVPRRPEIVTVARTQMMPAATVTSSGITTSASVLSESRRKNRRPAIIIGIIAVALVLSFAGFVVYMLTGGGQSGMVKVPNVVNYTQADAESQLRKSNLAVGEIKPEPSNDIPAGRVISTNPRADVLVERGSKVDLVVSSGTNEPEEASVPSIVGLDEEEAKRLLSEAGFTPQYSGERNSDTIDAGKVCQQSPVANSMAKKGTSVSYYVSKGKESTTIPWVIAMRDVEAEKMLCDIGFKVVYTDREYSDTVPKDCVIRQNPTSGTTATKGTIVQLTVSDGPLTVVPNIIGMTLSDAIKALDAVKLDFNITYIETANPYEVDMVLSCDPNVGSSVPKDSTITVVIGKEPPPPPPPSPVTPPSGP